MKAATSGQAGECQELGSVALSVLPFGPSR